jgi:hypothetical protein
MNDDSTRTLSRRQFASRSALAALSAAIAPHRVLGADAPSNKLNIAGVGVGGMGAVNLKACEGEEIVALCDVDSAYAAKAIAQYPQARFYKDCRVMLEEEKGIDSIRACKEGPSGLPPCSTFEYGGALTEMVLLGVLPLRLKDQRLEWDSAALRFTNNEAANELLHIHYRDGWRL